jgi:DNA polymerase III subunit epsilon
LREVDLNDQPGLDEQLDVISRTLAGAVMVAHFAWIETRFLSRALGRVGAKLDGPVIDTMALGRSVLRSTGIDCPPNPSLGFLAHSLNLPIHRPHHADGDALTTAQVFLALATRASHRREATVGDLARAASRRRRLAALLRGRRLNLSP